MTITQGFLDNRIFGIISEIAASKGVRAFVIGGYVRDCFLGRPGKDIDIVVEGSGCRGQKRIVQTGFQKADSGERHAGRRSETPGFYDKRDGIQPSER